MGRTNPLGAARATAASLARLSWCALSVLAAPGCSDAPEAAPFAASALDGGATAEVVEAGRVDGGAGADSGATGASLLAVADLPRAASTQALSATFYDEATRTLFALSDRAAHVVPLVANADFTRWTPGTPLSLTGRVDAAWDGEGLARIGTELVAVTVETAPLVERFDATGARLGAVPVPARFSSQAPGNKGLESLTVSPSGRFLFLANESALSSDGGPATRLRGTTVRILRRELATSTDVELAYRTEPLGAGAGGDMGVSELCALSDDVLLVLERGYQTGYGNTVRLFRVDLSTGADVSSVAALGDATPALAKQLVVDLASLPSSGVTHPSTQPSPLLDNYEALALGPRQADGRRIVFVTSDDNESLTQVARVLALLIPAP